MNPLSERSSMVTARVILVSLWITSIVMALPMIFFFEFLEVFDEATGGVKPFCTLSSVLHQQTAAAEAAAQADYSNGAISAPDYPTYEYEGAYEYQLYAASNFSLPGTESPGSFSACPPSRPTPPSSSWSSTSCPCW